MCLSVLHYSEPGCPIFFRFLKKWILRECHLDHNHCIGKEVICHYPSSRQLNKEEKAEVASLLTLNTNNKLLKGMLEEKFGKLILLKDIQNMKAKVRELSSKGLNDAQLVLEHLHEALEQGSLSKGVVINEDYTLEVLYFQTGHMRNMYEKFPEILTIDGTYNVNGKGMPLYCLMVEDGYGHVRVIFYAATTEEDTLHLQKIMQCLKQPQLVFTTGYCHR